MKFLLSSAAAALMLATAMPAAAVNWPFEIDCAILDPETLEERDVFFRGEDVLLTTDSVVPTDVADRRWRLRTVVAAEFRGGDFEYNLQELMVVPEIVEREAVSDSLAASADAAEGFEFHGEQQLRLPKTLPRSLVRLRVALIAEDGFGSQQCEVELQVR